LPVGQAVACPLFLLPGLPWSPGSRAARRLIEHGFDPSSPGCEFDVLRSRL